MKTQDLQNRLLKVIGPLDSKQPPLVQLDKIQKEETDEFLKNYFSLLYKEVEIETKTMRHGTDTLDELAEAEHDVLCRLIQIYFNDETKPFFKRYLTVVYLFPEYVIDIKLLLSILNYYNIFKKNL